MTIKNIPQKYRTSDGTEYESKETAEKHQALIDAKNKYEQASSNLAKCMAETQITADGKPFVFTYFRDYYFVRSNYFGFPTMILVECSPTDVSLEDCGDGFPSVVIRQRQGNGSFINYKISELYADATNAKRALLKAQEARLIELTNEVEELRKAVA